MHRNSVFRSFPAYLNTSGRTVSITHYRMPRAQHLVPATPHSSGTPVPILSGHCEHVGKNRSGHFRPLRVHRHASGTMVPDTASTAERNVPVISGRSEHSGTRRVQWFRALPLSWETSGNIGHNSSGHVRCWAHYSRTWWETENDTRRNPCPTIRVVLQE